jgi:hypothetical protein
MAQLPTAINTHDLSANDKSNNFEPMPAGKYQAMVVSSEMKPTKAGTGKYLELQFEVTEGVHQGRMFWDRLNVVNPNPTAVDIAERELASLGKACGLQTVTDSQQLHDTPITVKLKVKPASGDYSATNEPAGYFPGTTVKAQSSAPAEMPF